MNPFNDLPSIRTKISKPPYIKNLVHRSHLYKFLEEKEPVRIIVINTPAGYGKTSLVSSWIDKRKINAAWLTLDSSTNSPLILLAYLIKSIRNISNNYCNTSKQILNTDSPPTISKTIQYLLNDLEEIEEELVVVLDDFHSIDKEETNDLIEKVIEYSPLNIKFILLSRNNPRFSLSKFRMNGIVKEIDLYDLKFDLKDLGKFFVNNKDPKINQAYLEKVIQCTEGWAAGIQLASYSINNINHDQEIPDKICGKNMFISDFFFEEIYNFQDQSTKDFLVFTSIFKQFSASLCNTILDINNSQELLNYLINNNVFLVPLDQKNARYRFHKLFKEFLINQLFLKYSVEEISSIYQKGVKWFMQNEKISEAIELAIDFKDYELAVDLFSENLNFLYNQPLLQNVVLQWLSKIPLANLRKHLNVWYGYVLLLFRNKKFKKAEEIISTLWGKTSDIDNKSEEEKDSISGHIALLKCILMRHTSLDYPKIFIQSKLAVDKLPKKEINKIKICRSLNKHSAVNIDEVSSFRKRMSLSEISETISKKTSLSVSRLNYFALTTFQLGDLNKSEILYNLAYKIAEENNLQGKRTYGDANIGLGRLYYESNQVSDARQYIDEGLSYFFDYCSIESILFTWETVSPLLFKDGEINKLDTILGHIEKTTMEIGSSLYVQEKAKAIRANYNFQSEEYDKAIQWRENFVKENNTITSVYRKEWKIAASIYEYQNNYIESINILSNLAEIAERNKLILEKIYLSVSLINGYYRNGEEEKAIEIFRSVISDLDPKWHLQAMINSGDILLNFCEELSTQKSLPESVFEKIVKIKTSILGGMKAPIFMKNNEEFKVLTPREIDVLKLLAQGLTYQEIGNTLFISINTVRSYTKRIYTKLNVNSRMAAVNILQKKQ